MLPSPLYSTMSSSSSTDSASSSNPAEYLRTASFSRSEGPGASSGDAVTASDLLMAAYDPARLHPLAELGDKLDYLLLDDDKTSELPGAGTAIPSRGWSDDLCYGTGTMYLSGKYGSLSNYCICDFFGFIRDLVGSLKPSHTLSRHLERSIFSLLIVLFCHMLTLGLQGLALGGAWGVREGARRPLAVSNSRLRINSVLNSVTRRGTFIGNSAGVLGPSTFSDEIFACNH